MCGFDKRCEHQTQDRHQLHQDIQRRARRILEWIADRITNDSSLVGVAAFAAMSAAFDVFLGVVPTAAGIRG